MHRLAGLEQAARVALDLALGIVLAGLADLAITAWIDYLTHPGLSIVEAYQRGREPWSSIGIGAVIAGASLALLLGSLVALVEGSWIRRLLALAALGLGVAWWLTAMGVLPYPGFTGPAPVAFAFEWPRQATVGLLAPTVIASLLVLTPRREVATSRMGPVHPEDRR